MSFNFLCAHSKEEAGTRTAKLRQEKEVQDRHLQADVEALKNLEENLRQLTDRDQQLAAQVGLHGRVDVAYFRCSRDTTFCARRWESKWCVSIMDRLYAQ